jgi:hypothetical protein
MKSIQEVREELVSVFNGLKNGTLAVEVAAEMNNAAGKIIKSLAVQLDYYSLREEKPNIKFLKEESSR